MYINFSIISILIICFTTIFWLVETKEATTFYEKNNAAIQTLQREGYFDKYPSCHIDPKCQITVSYKYD